MRLSALVAFVVLLTACSKGVTPIHTAFNRGVYHLQKGETQAAVADFRRAVDEQPGDLPARVNLGIAYEQLATQADEDNRRRLRELAIKQYEYVLTREANHPRAGVNLAALDHEAGNTDAAIARLEEIVAANPDAAEPRLALASIHLTKAAYEKSQQQLKAILANDPGNTGANLLLGDIQFRLEQWPAAAASYQRALTSSPTSRSAMLALGRVELERDRPQDAMALARRLLLLDPDHQQGHVLAAEAAERLDDPQAAVYHLWRARPTASQDQRAKIDGRLAPLYQQLLDDLASASE